MLRRLGYVAIALSSDATTNRTCRLRNAAPERLRALIESNLNGLKAILEYNVENQIRLYRISSQIIPFASHPVNTLHWWDEFEPILVEIGKLIQKHGMRVSMHPGQFTVLNSRNPEVIDAAVRDLEWHTRLLDSLEVDGSHKVIIHAGAGIAGKDEAMERFADVANDLGESIRRRLVIENDERVYTARDVNRLSELTRLPVVFDWLHHQANHDSDVDDAEVVRACFDTWTGEDGVPKIHLSSQQAGGPPGKHADWIDVDDARAFIAVAPDTPFDCMLEAKQKDRALLRLREDLRRFGVVEANC